MRLATILLLWMFILVSPAMAAIGADSSSDGGLPRFEARAECFIEPPADLTTSFDMDCGTVAVPEFHHGDGEATGKGHIKLAVMRLHARQDSGQSPLFMLAGGPGSSLLKPDTLRLFQPGLLGGVLATRDVIIMDQRGADHSQPLLDCPAVYALGWIARQRKLNYVSLCKQIDVKSLPDSTDSDVGVDIPTLLLSGDLDVATPSFRSQIVADALPNATHIVFPGRTHVQIGGINQCAAKIATAFILAPTVALDLDCVKDTPTLSFVLPDGSMSK